MKKTIVILSFVLSLLVAWASVPQAPQPRAKRHAVNVDSLSTKAGYGIDVSAHQGRIDWQQVAQTPVTFVYVKATEGASFVDSRYKENIKGAREAGLKVGAFHFFRTTSGVHDQFNHFIKTIGEDTLDLIPVLDVEEKKLWNEQQLRDSVKMFVNLLEKHFGCKPMIYTGHKFYNSILGRAFNDCKLFIAQYVTTLDRKPDVASKWDIWQFSESGKVSGVRGYVDVNVLGDKVKLEDLMLPEKKDKKKKK